MKRKTNSKITATTNDKISLESQTGPLVLLERLPGSINNLHDDFILSEEEECDNDNDFSIESDKEIATVKIGGIVVDAYESQQEQQHIVSRFGLRSHLLNSLKNNKRVKTGVQTVTAFDRTKDENHCPPLPKVTVDGNPAQLHIVKGPLDIQQFCDKVRRFNCQPCKKQFDDGKEFFAHLILHNCHSCTLCPHPLPFFVNNADLKNHVTVHHPDTRLVYCPHCFAAYIDQTKLTIHTNHCHANKIQKNPPDHPHPCPSSSSRIKQTHCEF